MSSLHWLPRCLPALLFLPALAAGLSFGHLLFDSTDAVFEVEEGLDLGTVWSTDEHHGRLVIRNVSTQPQRVDSIDTSCDCTAVSPASFVLEPGKTIALDLVIDLTVRAGVAREPVSILLTPQMRTRLPQSLVWEVRGTVVSAVRRSEGKIDFGETLPGSPLELTAAFKLREPADLASIVRVPPPFLATLRRDGDSWLVQLKSAELPSGEFNDSLSYEVTSPAGEFRGRYLLGVRGLILSDILVQPPAVTLGRVSAGDSRTTTLSVRSHSSGPFVVESIESANPSVSVAVSPTSGDGVQVYAIEYTAPARAGFDTSTIDLRVRHHEGGISTHSVVVSALVELESNSAGAAAK